MSRYAFEWAKQQQPGTAEAKALLLVLADYAEGPHSVCELNEARLCGGASIDRSALPAAIKLLEDAGLITATPLPRSEPREYNGAVRFRARIVEMWGENMRVSLHIPPDWSIGRARRPDTAPRAPNAQPNAVYRLYDGAGVLLYVGITVRPEVRFDQHRQHKDWWPNVVTREITWYPDRYSAEAEEIRAIFQEKPLHNRVHGDASRWWPASLPDGAA